jgi:hydrogenase maturation protein HypF
MRAGHIAYRAMPGGPAAAKETWRMDLSYLWSAMGEPPSSELILKIEPMEWTRRIGVKKIKSALDMMRLSLNSPMTSSMGRIFDGAASLAGVADVMRYEGQAALMLEMAASADLPEISDYELTIVEQNGELIFNPDSLMLSILEDTRQDRSASEIGAHVHAAVVELWLKAALTVRGRTGIETVALSGGCFMNRFLLERISARLASADFTVLTHCQVPANDGGLSLGQAVIAASRLSHPGGLNREGLN